MPKTKQIFNNVARNYDLLNRALSLGNDRLWRKKLAREIGNQRLVLDIATGTADVAIEIANTWPLTRVVGLDPSTEMLDVARRKVRLLGLADRIELVEGVAESLPFVPETFDAVTIAFGIRNTDDPKLSLKEIGRVLKRGGKLGVLEFAVPQTPLFAPMYLFYLNYVVPLVGMMFNKGREYKYLAESIPRFPQREEFDELMRSAGIAPQKSFELSMGTVILYLGRKEAHQS